MQSFDEKDWNVIDVRDGAKGPVVVEAVKRLAEFVRPAKAEHRIEQCIQRGKSEAGLADYEVRTWRGWHHHQTLSLLATWFLVTEARRGKKIHAGDHGSPTPRNHLANPTKAVRMRYYVASGHRMREATEAKRTRPLVPLETA